MKNFLKALALICFGGALLVGIMVGVEHVKDNEKEEKVENPTITIKNVSGYDDLVIQYEEGMTWLEWIESDYNTFNLNDDSAFINDDVYCILVNEPLTEATKQLFAGDSDVLPSDLIDSSLTYYLN